MPVLACSVSNCYYNKSNSCCRENISVEGMHATKPNSTACGSFREKKDTTTNSCKCEQNPQPVVEIQCDAQKCCFNDECRCTADHISIAGQGACHYSETECSSFNCDCK